MHPSSQTPSPVSEYGPAKYRSSTSKPPDDVYVLNIVSYSSFGNVTPLSPHVKEFGIDASQL